MSEHMDSHGADDDSQVVLNGRMLLDRLADAHIVTETGDDIDLTSEFRRDWRGQIESVRTESDPRRVLAEILGVDPGELRVTETDDREFAVYYDGEAILIWESKAGFVADTAGYSILAKWLPLWENLDDISRNELLVRLRGFLDACPVCDGQLATDERGAETSTPTEVSVHCPQCGRVTFDGAFL